MQAIILYIDDNYTVVVDRNMHACKQVYCRLRNLVRW